MGRLQDRVAVITGAGDGIGEGIARRFAFEGAKVVIAEIDESRGRQVADEINAAHPGAAAFIRTDVCHKADNEAMVQFALDTFGAVDILVNNAWGGGTISRVEHKTDAQLDRGLTMGFRGPLWAMQAAFPHMKAKGWGRVINLCSLNGVNAHMGSLEYNTAKEALRTATRTAAREWASTGVVCNVICPAAKSASFRRVMAEHPELVAAADAANPMGRMGDPYDDIAPVAVFLASEDCRYLTGNTIHVDGGSHINGSSWAPELPDAPVA
jgi:NAD(P)-dependent dehydrogenase (short-subunit alcohol dehydrogenase family)